MKKITQGSEPIISKAVTEYSGDVAVLESAIGFFYVGRLLGWRAILLTHNKRTIARYQSILNIDIRTDFPEFGAFKDASQAMANFQSGDDLSYWKCVSSDIKGVRSPYVDFAGN